MLFYTSVFIHNKEVRIPFFLILTIPVDQLIPLIPFLPQGYIGYSLVGKKMIQSNIIKMFMHKFLFFANLGNWRKKIEKENSIPFVRICWLVS
jgi:hypothetical protein